MHFASMNSDNLEILKTLLERQEVDVNAKNEEGRTPLMKAVQWGNTEGIKVVLQIMTSNGALSIILIIAFNAALIGTSNAQFEPG